MKDENGKLHCSMHVQKENLGKGTLNFSQYKFNLLVCPKAYQIVRILMNKIND